MKILMSLLFAVLWGNFLPSQTLKTVVYKDGQQKLNGLVTSNAGRALPGVLILPAWKGIDDEAKAAALELEKVGYIAFIADIYGEGHYPKDSNEAAKLSSTYKNDYQLYQQRIKLSLNELKKLVPKGRNTAIIGYCFGGTGALEAARGQLETQGVVSIHGGLSKATDRPNTPIKTKILVEHPADDQSVKTTDIIRLEKELNDGNADWQFITYSHAKHTFTDPASPDYNEIMAKRAWQHTLLFLKEVLK